MLTRKEYLYSKLEPLVRPESLDSVVEYLLSFDLASISREDFEELLLDLCDHNKTHEISLISHAYFISEYAAEPSPEEATAVSDTSNPSILNKQAQDQIWPKPIGGSMPKLEKSKVSNSVTKLSKKLEGTVFMNPISLPLSKKNASYSLDKIGIKKVKPKQNKATKQKLAENQDKHHYHSECGCCALRHAYLGSCISCGRIFCEEEGPFSASGSIGCFFCHGIVLPPLSAEEASKRAELNQESTIRAYQQKDKLLLYDKENTKRTQVLDSQADYYESSTWLTEEEKRVIDEKEKKRYEKTHRKHHKIHIAYDVAGRKLVQVDPDSDDDNDVDMEEDNVSKDIITCHPMSHVKDSTEDDLHDHHSRGNGHDIGSTSGGGYDYSDSRAVNTLASQSSKAGVVYRKLISQLKQK